MISFYNFIFLKTKNQNCMLIYGVGSFDGEIHRAAIHRGDGRAAGAERREQHVRDRAGEDQRVGVLSRRRKRQIQEQQRAIRRLRAVAEKPPFLVLRDAHLRLQDHLRQQRHHLLAPIFQSTETYLQGPPTPPTPIPAGTGSSSCGKSVHQRSLHRGKDHKRRGLLHTEGGHQSVDVGGAERGEA